MLHDGTNTFIFEPARFFHVGENEEYIIDFKEIKQVNQHWYHICQ